MGDAKEKVRNQVRRHYREFMDDCEWPDMLEKYAELSNKYERARLELVNKDERGARLEDSDFADVEYYSYYQDMMARAIADNTLVSAGYETDKKGNWKLKFQPTEPPKKKFGFWK